MIGDLGFDLVDAASCGADAREGASGVARCVLGQIHRPYPCSASLVLMGPEDLRLPADLFCAFYGSFDWHSCVHSHWALVRGIGAGLFADELLADVVAVLDRTLSPQLIAAEVANWRSLPAHFERPYGLAWMLQLAAELARPGIRALHPGWGEALAPFVELASCRMAEWVEGLRLPQRSGTHGDTAWSLALAHDWARSLGRLDFAGAIERKARELYLRDRCAPVAYEPAAQTFTSSILNEAALMARVLPAEEYAPWLEGFLPQAFAGDEAPEALMADLPGTWDGTDYLGVHEVALPLARTLAARDAAAACQHPGARAYLAGQARRWGAQGLHDLTLQGYLADHWVGSFVMAVLAR